MQQLVDLQSCLHVQKLLHQKCNILLSTLTTDGTYSVQQFYEWKMKLNRFDQEIDQIQKELCIMPEPTDQLLNEIKCLRERMEICFFKMDRSEQDEHDSDGVAIIVGSNVRPKTHHKAHLSNNIIRIIRGPIKSLIHQTMVAIDVYGQELRPIESIQKAVQIGLERQNRKQTKQKSKRTNSSLKPPFTQITSDWKFEGENDDQGLSSISVWIRNPRGQRCLMKTEDHPLSAVNEWLAYVLGRTLALPINVVQISLYQGQLVTLHMDVTREDEKMITYMDLPKKKRKLLLYEPLLVRMDIFDYMLQNADRNQRNILITVPKSADINEDPIQMKIHFVDHGACFGMHKLNAISIAASKLHFNRIGVIGFDPKQEADKFEEYLNGLPVEDRPFTIDLLNRFAAISDQHLDKWMNEVQDLLTTNQYNRISEVLRLKRDVAKRCSMQWNHIVDSSQSQSSLIMIYL